MERRRGHGAIHSRGDRAGMYGGVGNSRGCLTRKRRTGAGDERRSHHQLLQDGGQDRPAHERTIGLGGAPRRSLRSRRWIAVNGGAASRTASGGSADHFSDVSGSVPPTFCREQRPTDKDHKISSPQVGRLLAGACCSLAEDGVASLPSFITISSTISRGCGAIERTIGCSSACGSSSAANWLSSSDAGMK
jgi:hypothetical protein